MLCSERGRIITNVTGLVGKLGTSYQTGVMGTPPLFLSGLQQTQHCHLFEASLTPASLPLKDALPN